MTGRLWLPFDLSLGGGRKKLDCDPETERIGRLDGELTCVREESPAPRPGTEPEAESEADSDSPPSTPP